MTSSRSQSFMYTEMVVVLVPVTAFEVLAFMSLIDLYGIEGRSRVWVLLPLAVILSPLVATWRLCIAHASRGSGYARSVSRSWWFLATAGAGVPLMGITALLANWTAVGLADSAVAYYRGLVDDPFGAKSAVASAVLIGRYAAVTAPLLIPLIHLWWEGAGSDAMSRGRVV